MSGEEKASRGLCGVEGEWAELRDVVGRDGVVVLATLNSLGAVFGLLLLFALVVLLQSFASRLLQDVPAFLWDAAAAAVPANAVNRGEILNWLRRGGLDAGAAAEALAVARTQLANFAGDDFVNVEDAPAHPAFNVLGLPSPEQGARRRTSTSSAAGLDLTCFYALPKVAVLAAVAAGEPPPRCPLSRPTSNAETAASLDKPPPTSSAPASVPAPGPAPGPLKLKRTAGGSAKAEEAKVEEEIPVTISAEPSIKARPTPSDTMYDTRNVQFNV